MATQAQIAEQNMSANDQAALKAAGDRYNAAKAAGDTAGMEAAHRDAENIRSGYGYSGGANGAGYTPTDIGGSKKKDKDKGNLANSATNGAASGQSIAQQAEASGGWLTPELALADPHLMTNEDGTMVYQTAGNVGWVPTSSMRIPTYSHGGYELNPSTGQVTDYGQHYYSYYDGSGRVNDNASANQQIGSTLSALGFTEEAKPYLEAAQKEALANQMAGAPDAGTPAAGAPAAGTTGAGGPEGGTPTFVLRNGQMIPAYIVNGKTVDANGNPFAFQNGDRVNTGGGVYLWQDGKATVIPGTQPTGTPTLSVDMLYAEMASGVPAWQLSPESKAALQQMLNYAGDASLQQSPQTQKLFKQLMNYASGIEPFTPSAETQAAFADWQNARPDLAAIGANIPQAEFNWEANPDLATDYLRQVHRDYADPQILMQYLAAQNAGDTAQMEALLAQMTDNQIGAASNLGMFNQDYLDIRDNMLKANDAATEMGVNKLRAQLENTLPTYDEQRAQTAIDKEKAASNAALRNAVAGDRGGIGERAYSLEQNAYDQRMLQIQLEQISFTNSINQQIAQLEAEGKYNEANLLAEWGQARVNALQNQYNNYWNMRADTAYNLDNLNRQLQMDEYNIAADAYNRAFDREKWEFNKELEAAMQNYQNAGDLYKQLYGMDQDTYNSQVDLENQNYQRLANALSTSYGMDVDKYNSDIKREGLDYGYLQDAFNTLYGMDTDAYQFDVNANNTAYNRQQDALNRQQANDELAYERALQRIQMGVFDAEDAKALGMSEADAKRLANYFKDVADIDLATQRAQLAKNQGYGSSSGGGGGGGRGSGGDSVSTDSGLADWQLIDKMIAAGVTPDLFTSALQSGAFGKLLSNSADSILALKSEFDARYKKAVLGISPSTGTKGTTGTALEILGYGDLVGNSGATGTGNDVPNWNTLLWGVNNDPAIQSILGLKGAPYASQTETDTTALGSANYKGKR